ncbi:RHS repeat-associated core domain-containing protein [Superficieibacter sp.]|uniref:RHS repeat-associated core domain-containing protein n=1 Tax=Superficieibacter sp. TaxID=2303322 RepID=UPI0039181E45
MWHYRYDSGHRMTEAVTEIPSGTGKTRHEVRFSHDPLGRRTEKRSVVTEYENGRGRVKETQRVTTFVWEGLRLLAENRDGLPLVYVYEDPGSYTPLARIWGSGENARVDYYRCSQNGMPEALTDAEGKEHWRPDADTWGETLGEYADERGSYWYQKHDGAPEENLRFAGQYLDRETGLHYNTFRYYAPDMGRFLTPDPIGLRGGLNLYAYAPNPLSWIDPLGLNCKLTNQQFKDKLKRIRNQTAAGGNRGITGIVSNNDAFRLGEAFVGPNYKRSSGYGSDLLISEDGLRQYRGPFPKGGRNALTGEPWSKTGTQVNFQSRTIPEGSWSSNVHLDTEPLP